MKNYVWKIAFLFWYQFLSHTRQYIWLMYMSMMIVHSLLFMICIYDLIGIWEWTSNKIGPQLKSASCCIAIEPCQIYEASEIYFIAPQQKHWRTLNEKWYVSTLWPYAVGKKWMRISKMNHTANYYRSIYIVISL